MCGSSPRASWLEDCLVRALPSPALARHLSGPLDGSGWMVHRSDPTRPAISPVVSPHICASSRSRLVIACIAKAGFISGPRWLVRPVRNAQAARDGATGRIHAGTCARIAARTRSVRRSRWPTRARLPGVVLQHPPPTAICRPGRSSTLCHARDDGEGFLILAMRVSSSRLV
jgi:hypothetical protein